MAGFIYFSEEAGGVSLGSQFFFPLVEAAMPALSERFGKDFADEANSELDYNFSIDFSGLDAEQYRFAHETMAKTLSELGFVSAEQRRIPNVRSFWDKVWKEVDTKMRSDPRFHAKAA